VDVFCSWLFVGRSLFHAAASTWRPAAKAVLEPSNLRALGPERGDRLEGQDAVRTAAIGDDLLILRKLREPPFQLIERHVERTWQMAERELVLRANVEQGHATILKPAKQFLTRDQTYELGPGRIGRANATPNLIP
jgi:hypothetical protein